MAPGTIRKAIGVVKDQTSISIAKVAGNIAPDLEVLVVKTTSHDEDPADEKYYREIINLTFSSRGYVSASMAAISKRITKTRDWMVALKSLMLVHRIVVDGHPSFAEEIVHSTGKGLRLLNLSGFRDEAHSNSWDHAGFVRAYALYLAEKVQFEAFERKPRIGNGGKFDEGDDGYGRREFRGDDGYERRESRGDDGYGRRESRGDDWYGRREYSGDDGYGRRESRGDDGYGRRESRGDDEYGRREYKGDDRYGRREYNRDDFDYGGTIRRSRSYGDSREDAVGRDDRREAAVVTPIREMRPEKVLVILDQMLRILDRILSCKPSGLARNSRLVLVALYRVVRESFLLYSEICEALKVLLDRFTEMEYSDCITGFDMYVSAAKMIDELVGFYGWCKDVGVARSSEYPEVQKITDSLLGTLKGFLKEMTNGPPKSPERIREEKVSVREEPEQAMNETRALPAPDNFTPAPPPPEVQPKAQQPQQPQQVTEDLVNLRDGVSAEEQGNKLALVLFAETPTAKSNGEWEAFPSNGEPEVTSAWQTPAAESGKADWELALVESAGNLSKQKATMAGGFDPLILNGMYDQGAVRQHVSTSQLSGGSSSSVSLPVPGKSATPVLALPAPDGTVQPVGNQDPFAASLAVPPPSYVQIADMERKQQLLVQEQQLWQQYGSNGMQGPVGLAKISGASSYPGSQTMTMPYGMPQFSGTGQPGGYYYSPY